MVFTALFQLNRSTTPSTFQLGAVWTATSISALTYIGFDGITTLSGRGQRTEEDRCARDRPCVFAYWNYLRRTGSVSGPTRLARLQHLQSVDTAFFDVCGKVGGVFLNDNFCRIIMVVASLGSALTGQFGAARVLYGMGRDNALPKKFFGRLDPKHNSPPFNILLIGFLALSIAIILSYEQAVPILNFGAFLAFMGVNASVIGEFVVRTPAGHKRNWLWDLISPVLGFIFCAVIWVFLPTEAKTYGGIWCALGIVYAGYKHALVPQEAGDDRP